MRRLILIAVGLAVVGIAAMGIVSRSCAERTQQAVKPAGDVDPFAEPTAKQAEADTVSRTSKVVAPPQPLVAAHGGGMGVTPAVQPSVPAPQAAAPTAQPYPAINYPPPPPPPLPLVRILTPEMAAAPEPQTAIDAARTDADAAAEAKIRAALVSPTEFNFVATPLKDVVEYLKNYHKIEIHLDKSGLADAGVPERAPVNKRIKGISLRSALGLMLPNLGPLTYVIKDGVLLITSRDKSDASLTTKLYPVKDLILVRNEKGEIETDFQSLIDVITSTVQPTSWDTVGGPGSITPYQFQDRCLLVVSETCETHEEVANLLAALRRCGPSDAERGKELRLPKRGKAVVPTLCAPSRPPR